MVVDVRKHTFGKVLFSPLVSPSSRLLLISVYVYNCQHNPRIVPLLLNVLQNANGADYEKLMVKLWL